MPGSASTPSARQTELLERAYAYAQRHGLADLSLRPLATAIGTSPRVLLFLFGSKQALIGALLARARADELALLDAVPSAGGLGVVAERVWAWLAAADHRPLLVLWVEAYARSLVEPDGAWAGFARTTVDDWLGVLAAAQAPEHRTTQAGLAERSLVLAVLRGALLDLLATGDVDRTTAAVQRQLGDLLPEGSTGTR